MSTLADWPSYLASFPPRDPKFVKQGYAIGLLPREIADELGEAILEAQHTPIANAVAPNSELIALPEETLRRLNEEHLYRCHDARTAQALEKAFICLKDKVATLLNSPWRVLNIRSWTTEKASEFGPNEWHKDPDLPEILKMMIYSSEDGGINLRTADGDKFFCGLGTWVLFYNSVVRHQGVAGDGVRVATEVTIAPSRDFDLNTITLGQVAIRPLVP